MSRRPSFQFYPNDWMNDLDLRQCSIDARCLWIDMLCIMHDGVPYGHLRSTGGDISAHWLANRCGISERVIKRLLNELEKYEVFSRNPDETIYSRRMVSDELNRLQRANIGGNRALSGNDINITPGSDGMSLLTKCDAPAVGASGGRLDGLVASTTNVSSSSSSLIQSTGNRTSSLDIENTDNRIISAPDGAEDFVLAPPAAKKPDPIKTWFDLKFWPLYPRKVDKAQALKEARRTLPGHKPSEIMTGLIAQLPRFLLLIADGRAESVPHASTWLHKQRWNDEIEPGAIPISKSSGLTKIEEAMIAGRLK